MKEKLNTESKNVFSLDVIIPYMENTTEDS